MSWYSFHMLRVGVLSYESHQSCAIVRGLLDSKIFEPVVIVRSTVIDPRRKGLPLLRFLGNRDRRSFVLRKGLEVQASRAARTFHTLLSRPPISLKSMSNSLGIPCFDCASLGSEELLSAVSATNCDLLLSVHFNHLLTEPWRTVSRLGAINVHGSLLPAHRGLFPHFFALSDGDSTGGVTVHWIDDRLDTGRAIAVQPIKIESADTVFGLANKAIPASILAITEAIRAIELDETSAGLDPQPSGPTRYHSWPTRADMKRLKQQKRRYLRSSELLGLFGRNSRPVR